MRPESAPLLLTDLDQKLALLEACGADLTLVVHFDAERAAERAEDFVAEVLVGCLNARAVIVGHDFHFGHNREGDVPLLQRMGARMGFDVTGIRLLGAGGAATQRRPGQCRYGSPGAGSCCLAPSRSRQPASAASSPKATWPGRPPSSVAGTSCAGWSATVRSGARARLPDGQPGGQQGNADLRRRCLRRLVPPS